MRYENKLSDEAEKRYVLISAYDLPEIRKGYGSVRYIPALRVNNPRCPNPDQLKAFLSLRTGF